jgi:hypothetical protein
MPRYKERSLDWLSEAAPWQFLAPLALPVGHQLGARWHHWFESARMIETAFAFIHNKQIPGDYLEFGVHRGRTFAAAWEAARRDGRSGMRFHAFDSWEGLPSLSPEDEHGRFHEGQFACDRATFERRLRKRKVDPPRVAIRDGFFEQTLSRPGGLRALGIAQASLTWIDCDLYTSARQVLSVLGDVVVNGTVLVFDAWYCYAGRADGGEQRACSEWLAAHAYLRLVAYQKFHWAGASFLVHLDEAPRPDVSRSE